ncbi:white collar-1 transcript variant 1 [Amniculicola lignicola CBS 123094]|uniref:White collar-1 transcript variant 1 n=1 Tax=Amniculicola lignicola CBS 123094 TaxID=1392246 RepID=A0A6A5X4W0_9PLEO|nr:white collar-1 transcript variant 1 [Amniculicola lignicola CBS 123094]
MNGYPPYPQRPYEHPHNAPTMMDMSGHGINFDMIESQTLDEIVSQNEKANRRKSMPVYAGGPLDLGGPDNRRMSMMTFGDPSGAGNGMDEFQFSLPTSAAMEGLMRGSSTSFPRGSGDYPTDRMPGDLAINTQMSTQMSTQNSPYSAVPPTGSAYASPVHPSVSMDMDMNSPYPMSMPMDMDSSMNMMGQEMNMFGQAQFANVIIDSPVDPDFTSSRPGPNQDPSFSTLPVPDPYGSISMTGSTPEARSGMTSRTDSREQSSRRSISRTQSDGKSLPSQLSNASVPPQDPPRTPAQQDDLPDNFGQLKFPWTTPPGGFPSTMNSNPHMNTQFKNAYSSTGFDMLGVLMRVATRPNPQIDIGSVDLSCAFVVCDAHMDDIPIVYCSENFERLTGYSKHMILGRNCRFLQSPDGKVEPGVKRKYCDDESVLYLKNTISTRQEAQISLINYRRGGQPFMNLLTMIPISWDSGGDTKFFVGFQVDLVEQPGSVLNKNNDGSYRVNYQRGISMPSYVPFNIDSHRHQPEMGQTISKDEVSTALATYGTSGDSEITRRIWDKVLLENTDDVVFVLSLKALFLYLSPSSNKVLEYDPSELVGTALSSVCHPSDIVPVTRELKETSTGIAVNVVFRIRRKKNGYMWFEGHGSLHTEQGKGRKCIILVGRERPVYTLSKTIIRSSGGIGDNELWSKMSTSGMFLYVASNVRQLLDRQPDDLVGTSIQALMRPESKQNFGRILELARSGRKGEVKHEMLNRRGQVLQAFTTIYPGDATEGQKPTFVVSQTRLLKYSRNAGQRSSMCTTKERNSTDLEAAPSVMSGPSASHPPTPTGLGGSSNSYTPLSENRFHTTESSAATFAGVNGLALGRQDKSLASEDNIFDELKTTRSTSWQYELRQMEKRNRYLAEEVQSLLAAKKKRKRRKGAGQLQKDCANCHTTTTPEWRRGPSGNRDLCNSCGLRWAKQNGRVSPRHPSQNSGSDKSRKNCSPRHSQTILPNSIPEIAAQSSVPSTLTQSGKRSPMHSSGPSGPNHAAKVARTEAHESQGYGIPPKIDEEPE